MDNYYYFYWQSPIGSIFLFANDISLKALHFSSDKSDKSDKKEAEQNEVYIKTYEAIAKKNTVIAKTIKELTAYFKGELTDFTVSVEPEGTEFQKKAWSVLREIPYGQVISYGEQAFCLQNPKAVRAVGQANGRNPIPIIIPCHRVVAKDKSIGGYNGGIMLKRKLLAIEKSLLPSMCGN